MPESPGAGLRNGTPQGGHRALSYVCLGDRFESTVYLSRSYRGCARFLEASNNWPL